jgi:2-keto-4-pentenoate hydratase
LIVPAKDLTSGGDLSTAALEAAAASIRRAYASSEPASWAREVIGATDISGAYAIQNANTRHWQAEGRRVVGQKIGLTSLGVQKQLGVAHPDFGVLFADMACSDGEDIAISRLRRPRVEGEAALMIGRDLPQSDLTLAELISAVEYVVPAIEVVDTRFESWKITLADTVADNASSGLFVIGGKPVRLGDVDLAEVRMTLSIDGATVSQGSGRECMGHPLRAALWLARTLALLGTPLKSGQLVMAGALGPMVDLRTQGQSSEVTCQITGLGSVRCRFVSEQS